MHLQRGLRLAEKAIATITDRWPDPPTALQRDLAKRLTDDLDALSDLDGGHSGAAEGSHFWQGI